jgi:hypothetical protein
MRSQAAPLERLAELRARERIQREPRNAEVVALGQLLDGLEVGVLHFAPDLERVVVDDRIHLVAEGLADRPP